MGGSVDRRSPCAPFASTSAIFGNLPSATHGLIKSNVAPSHPMINTRVMNFFQLARPGKPLLNVAQRLQPLGDQLRLFIREAVSNIAESICVDFLVNAFDRYRVRREELLVDRL